MSCSRKIPSEFLKRSKNYSVIHPVYFYTLCFPLNRTQLRQAVPLNLKNLLRTKKAALKNRRRIGLSRPAKTAIPLAYSLNHAEKRLLHVQIKITKNT